MHGKYECKNAHEKQQKTQNKKIWSSNKNAYLEQLEDNEECNAWIFRKNAQILKTCNWHQT